MLATTSHLPHTSLVFWSGREVVNACSQLVEDIVDTFCHKKVMQVVMLDIQSVYDTIWRNGLIWKLEIIGMDSYITTWIHSSLSDRCYTL